MARSAPDARAPALLPKVAGDAPSAALLESLLLNAPPRVALAAAVSLREIHRRALEHRLLPLLETGRLEGADRQRALDLLRDAGSEASMVRRETDPATSAP